MTALAGLRRNQPAFHLEASRVQPVNKALSQARSSEDAARQCKIVLENSQRRFRDKGTAHCVQVSRSISKQARREERAVEKTYNSTCSLETKP